MRVSSEPCGDGDGGTAEATAREVAMIEVIVPMATVRVTAVRASEKEMEGERVVSRAAKVARVETRGGMIEEASIEPVSAREVKAIVVSGGKCREVTAVGKMAVDVVMVTGEVAMVVTREVAMEEGEGGGSNGDGDGGDEVRAEEGGDEKSERG